MYGYKVMSTEIEGAIPTPVVEKQSIKGIWEQPEVVSELVKLPRVLPFYAKTRQTLEQIMEYVEQNPSDLAVQSLLNAHSTYSPKNFPFRGFCLINGEQRMRQIEQVDELVHRPIWFLFSGMGIEQWRCGMAREMMKLDSFRSSIMRSCELLKPFGINLLQLVNGEQQDKQFVMTGVESFVYMTAIQIALVDCLRLIGIRAEGMIGQSVGELVCAYIDQCLTHEQALMCSYYFANCLQQAQNMPKSLMAVVGDLTWEQLKIRCPKGVVPVCFDSLDQVVITGPIQIVRDLLRQLRLEGIFVREIEIPSTTITNVGVSPSEVFVQNFGLVHTQYLNDVLPMLRKCLATLNIVPKTRSSKWISTCCLPEQYTTPVYQTMSIDYLCKLFTTPVMLQQSLMQVPKNVVLIEISPRCLMQTLLKKVLYNPVDLLSELDVPFILPLTPLLNINIDPFLYIHHFLTQLGRLFVHGVDFDSIKLFVPSIFEQSIYPVPISQSNIDFFSSLEIDFESSTFILPDIQKIDSHLEIKNSINTQFKTAIEFFPFTQIQSPSSKSGYIMVDKDHNDNDFVFNSIQPTAESKCILSDFFDYYFSECNRFLKHLIYKINNPDNVASIEAKSLPTTIQEHIEKYTIIHQTISNQVQISLAELLQGGSFLKFLINSSTNLPAEPAELIKGFNQSYSEDLVFDQISNSTLYLKNFFNLLIENLSTKDSGLKILEISTSKSQLCAKKCMDILSSYPDLKHKIDYHFAPLNFTYVKNDINKLNILNWNLKIQNGKFESQIPDEFFGQFDLVMLNGCLSSSIALSSEQELKNWLQGPIQKLLKSNGFVLFNEFTSNLDFVQNFHRLEMIINGNQIKNTKLINQIRQLESFRNQSSQDIQIKIEQQVKQLEKLLINDQILSLKLQDTEQWRVFLDELIFAPIGYKTDSALKSVFLYRKPLNNQRELIISIDEFLACQNETVSLFEKINQGLNDETIDRVWLLNERPIHPLSLQIALISVFEGLRAIPNGHKLRCLFLHDDQKIVFGSEEMQNCKQVMEHVRNADLVMNYFQGGLWGSVNISEVIVEEKLTETEIENIKYQELFKQNETYVIVNGIDSEFGLNLIQWMVECGAKYLTVTTKKSNVSEFMNVDLFKKLNDLQDIYGAEIRISSVLDLNEENECLGLIRQSCKGSPEGKIGGIFHLGDLCDEQNFQSMFNLDRLTRCGSIMPETGYFVVFTTGPNDVVEKLCNLRFKESNKQALCIDFNVLIEDLVEDKPEVRSKRCIDFLEDVLNVSSKKKQDREEKVEEKLVKKKVNLMPKALIEKLNDIEITDADKYPIFVVHPIEGHVNMLRTWAQKFDLPVFGLQYTEECLKYQTIEQLSEFYLQQIGKLFSNLKKFHLVGHTFGAPVAFEMASQRPQQICSLSLLDCAYTKTFLNTFFVGEESNFELEILYKFYQQLVVSNVRLSFEEFRKQLAEISNPNEHIKYVVGKIVEQSQFMFELNDIEAALRSFILKSSMALKYVPTKALILNKILVVRPYLINGVQQSLKNILNLYHYFGGECTLKTVDSTEKTFLISENAEIVADFVKEHIGLKDF